MPKGVSTDVLGYWFPEDGKGVIGNDCISVPAVAEHPRLGHEFLNFWISDKYATENFVGWNGYQPPLNSIDATKLIDQGSVPPTLERAVVLPSDFDNGYVYTSLPPDVDQMWLDAWNEFKAGG
jgi:spermidine/putrescine-binding protein